MRLPSSCSTRSNASRRGLASLHGLIAAALTVTVPLATANAASSARTRASAESEKQDAECEATPSLEVAKLITARDLHARGEEAFDKGDYLGAAAAWEQVIVLMPEKQADLRVQLAHAHRGAHAVDADEEHLHSAHALFTEQLASLDSDDAARRDLEAELAEIEATLAALEEDRVKARAEREDAIRQEQIRRNQQALAEAEARHQRNIQRIYHGVGGSLAGLGVGSMAAMAAFLAKGVETERQGRALATTTDVPDGRYEALITQGVAQNDAALATGIVGGLLTVSGASLLIAAALRHGRPSGRRDRTVAVQPTLGGMRLRF